MPAALAQPQGFFFDRFGLTERALERVLGTAAARRADDADLYFEFRTVETASLEEGLVKRAAKSINQGVGVRVLTDEKTGYAHTDEITPERLAAGAPPAP